MSGKISDTRLSQLAELVANTVGLHFPKERWPDLERAMEAACRESGRNDIDRFAQAILSSPSTRASIEVIAKHLTVGETYFFREKLSLDALRERIAPDLIQLRSSADRRLRVWSAGCATGEEPYSIAIVLTGLIADLKNWNLFLLGTDVNTEFLRRAAEGVYGKWSFRETPEWIMHAHFSALPNRRWAISPSVRSMVTFAHLNLADDTYPSLLTYTNAMDVIFCRNVLMYLTPEAAKKVVHQLYLSLAEGGWLIVSPTEASHTLFSEFTSVRFGDVTVYRKAPALQVVREHHLDPLSTHERDVNNRLEEAEDQREKPIEASFEQASRLYERGQYPDAEAMILGLLAQDQENGPAMLLLARTYANEGKLSAALSWCERAIGSDKMVAPAHYLRATILQEQGATEESAVSLRRALYADPQFVIGHFALGNLVLQRGELKESEKHFENALSLLLRYEPDAIVPESDGISARKLIEIIALRSQPISAIDKDQATQILRAP